MKIFTNQTEQSREHKSIYLNMIMYTFFQQLKTYGVIWELRISGISAQHKIHSDLDMQDLINNMQCVALLVILA